MDGSMHRRFVMDACPCHRIRSTRGKTGSDSKGEPSRKGVLESFDKPTSIITIGNIGEASCTMKAVARIFVIRELNARGDAIFYYDSSRTKTETISERKRNRHGSRGRSSLRFSYVSTTHRTLTGLL